MAAETINFNLTSKWSGEGMEAAAKAIRQNGQELDSAKKGATNLATAIQGVSPEAAKATSAIGGMIDAFKTGGIVGGTFQVATMAVAYAIDYCVKKYNEAREAAIAYASALRSDVLEASKELNASFAEESERVNDLTKSLKSALDESVSDTLYKAERDVYQAHMETLEAVSLEMTDAGKAYVQAQGQMREALIRAQAAVDNAKAADEYYGRVRGAMTMKVQAAEETLANVTEEREKLERQIAGTLVQRQQIEDALTKAEEDAKNGVISWEKALEIRKEKTAELTAFEEKNKTALADREKVEQAVTEAEKNLKKAQEELAAAVTAQRKSNNALETAQIQLESKYADLSESVDKARDARDEECERIEAENEALDEYMEALDDTLESMENGTYYIDQINEGLEGVAKKVKDGDLIKIDISASASAAAETSENTKTTAEEAKIIAKNFGEFKQKAAQAAREARTMANARKTDEKTFIQWLKGNLNGKEAKAFQKYMMDNYDPKIFKEMYTDAIKKQLLGSSELREQFEVAKKIYEKLDVAMK